MSSKDDIHPELKLAASLDGQSEQEIDLDQFALSASVKFVVNPADLRAATLHKIDAAIDADQTNGRPLRQTSQLVSLRRRLGAVHDKLLRVKR
jgi:hypothetical protein